MDNTQLQNLKTLVDKATSQLSRVSAIGGAGDATSLNELKNAFVALLDDLVNNNQNGLPKAISHVKTAIRNCYDIEVLYCLNAFTEFAESWENTPLTISEFNQEWDTWCMAMENLETFRISPIHTDLDQYVASLDAALSIPRTIIPRLKFLNQSLKKKLKQQQKNDFYAKTGVVAALLAIAATFGVYLLQKEDAKASSTPPTVSQAPAAAKNTLPSTTKQ